MTTNSKTPQDNTELFARLAKEWTSCEIENATSPDFVQAGGLKAKENTQTLTGSVDTSSTNTSGATENFHLANVQARGDGIEVGELTRTDATAGSAKVLAQAPPHFTRFYSHLHSSLTQAVTCSPAQSEELAKHIMSKPQQAFNWHLYLMANEANGVEIMPKKLKNQEASDANEQKDSQDIKDINEKTLLDKDRALKKVEVLEALDALGAKAAFSWLKEGIVKGWLRYADLHEFTEPLHHAYLPQDKFWEHFTSLCDYRRGRVSLVLFKVPDIKENNINQVVANSENMADLATGLQDALAQDNGHITNEQQYTSKSVYLRELIEQILLAVKGQDFFGEIKDIGVGLVLPEHGSFSATACAERIVTRMEKALKNMPEYAHISMQVAVAEIEEGENAEILFKHAKEALEQGANKTYQFGKHIASSPSFTNIAVGIDVAKMKNIYQDHRLRVNVYRNTHKDKEKKSLVQSDEKRFLFFGLKDNSE